MSEPEIQKPEEPQQEFPLPPATFEFLIFSLRTQAELQLGLMHFGEEGEKTKPNLPMAQHAIDLLGVLRDKTKGNLSVEEERFLENSLTELRFRYVQAAESQQQK